MGDKAVAKATMIANKVPVVPGSDGVVATYEDARNVCEEIGYPLIIKASAGGGGRGMRVVEEASELKRTSKCVPVKQLAHSTTQKYISNVS